METCDAIFRWLDMDLPWFLGIVDLIMSVELGGLEVKKRRRVYRKHDDKRSYFSFDC